jgi:hypothetical protein
MKRAQAELIPLVKPQAGGAAAPSPTGVPGAVVTPARISPDARTLAQARKLIAASDTNKDGKLSKEELGDRFKAFERFDHNGDGCIDEAEMCEAIIAALANGNARGTSAGGAAPQKPIPD